MSARTELSVLITSYKNPALLKLCIKSIQRNVVGIAYDIIVADSETQEETYDVMRESFPEIKFLPNKNNVGFGGLVNQMLKVADSEIFFVINADIIVKNDAINELYKFLKGHDEVGIVGPKLINFDNTVQQSCFRFYSPLTVLYRRTFLGKMDFAKRHLEKFTLKQEQEENRIMEVDWLMGSAMMVSGSAVKKVGNFDVNPDKFCMYFEDVDWCRRFWENDYKVIFNPRIEVFHYHGKGSAKKEGALNSLLFNRLARMHVYSGIKFFIKYLGKPNPHQEKNNPKN